MAFLFSVNGKLTPLSYLPKKRESRSKNYGTVAVGDPLVISYLYFFIKGAKKGRHLMISNFCKAKEKKRGAAEAVTYYKPGINKIGAFRLSDFGAKDYGHWLCYYTDSYLGETIRLTTKALLLPNNNNSRVVTRILKGAKDISAIPVFLEAIPYLAAARAGIKIFSQIVNLFSRKNTAIIGGDSLDMHFGKPNVKQLQSGRIVAIPDEPDSKKVRGRYIKHYKLSEDNKLLGKDDDEEYTENSYYVFQVNSKRNDNYKDFDYSQDAAALLKKAQEGSKSTEFINTVTDGCKAYNDINIARRIDALRKKPANEKNTREVKALFNRLSAEMQNFCKPYFQL